MTAGLVGERLARIEARLEALEGEKLPERMRAQESWKSLLMGIVAAATVAASVVGFVWGDAIKKALNGS